MGLIHLAVLFLPSTIDEIIDMRSAKLMLDGTIKVKFAESFLSLLLLFRLHVLATCLSFTSTARSFLFILLQSLQQVTTRRSQPTTELALMPSPSLSALLQLTSIMGPQTKISSWHTNPL